jgi:hypothetical protein
MIDPNATYLIVEFKATGQAIAVWKLGADATAADLVKAQGKLSWHSPQAEREVRTVPGSYLIELLEKVGAADDIRTSRAYQGHDGWSK